MSDSPHCTQLQSACPATGNVQATHTSHPGKQTLERINGERGSCGCKKEIVAIICSQLKGEENKPFVCPSSSLPPLQRLPLPLLLEWGRSWGRGLHLATQIHLSGSRTKKIALRK